MGNVTSLQIVYIMLNISITTVCIKKRLVFEIQISHIVLNSSDKYIAWNHLASRKTKDFLLMGHMTDWSLL